MPDVLGMEMSRAISLLEREGHGWQVIETRPVKKREAVSDGPLRIIKQNTCEGLCRLIVCKIPDCE